MLPTSNNAAAYLLEGKNPCSVALMLLQRDHTYGELVEAATRVASFLVQLGASKGDRVILLADNSLFWVASYLGALKAGCVCAPLPSTTTSPDLAFILQTTEARIVFCQTSFALKNASGLPGIHLVTDREAPPLPDVASQHSFDNVLQRSDSPALPDTASSDLAALMFTSGSTAKPRGVMVTHANIIANTESIIQVLQLSKHDRMMTVLPFHYCFGTSLLHTHLRVGGRLVIDSRFLYPEVIVQRMLSSECTGFAGVPSHFQILLRNSTLRKKEFPHLRFVQQAGGYLAPSFVRELSAALPHTQIFIMYGQTEATARLSYLPPDMLASKPGSIGKGMSGVTLRVLDNQGEQVQPGDIGEIVAQGANVTNGYWRSAEESDVSFRNGMLYTGDLATVDADGFIYIVDRAKDFVKCGGKRVSCRQIEEQLLACDDLVEAAVIGVPDDVLGEAVKAFLVPRGRQSSELLERIDLFCKQHLPPQLIPKEIVLLPALPKSTAGKVLKSSLRAAPQILVPPARDAGVHPRS